MPRVDSPQFGAPIWFDLMTSDLDGMRAFYGGIFAWSYVEGPPDTGTMARLDGLDVAGLGAQPPGATWPSAWQVFFGVADVEAACAAVTAAGGTLAMPPMDMADA